MLRHLIEPDVLKQLIGDRYTGAVVVERLDLTPQQVLDFCIDDVYNNIIVFDEVLQDLGIEVNEDGTIKEESTAQQET